MSISYSTVENISQNIVNTYPENITNKYITYPDLTGKRYAEGGLRTKNKYKHSLKNKPLVTVVTVVFNGEKFLERCILSVLNQTYDNIEYIIIDGGSTDSTLNIIKKYEDNIDYFVSEPDDGIYYAMNKGLELASGDYIAILNSDDYYYDFAVKNSVETLIDTSSEIVAAHADILDEENNIINIYALKPFDEVAFLTGIIACHQTMFISKHIYNDVGYYNTTLRIASDTDLIFKIIDLLPKYALIKYSTVAFTMGGASSNLHDMWRENTEVMSNRLKGMSIKELDSLSKFAGGWIGTYDFDFVYPLIFKYDFTAKQKELLYRRVLEVKPEKCMEIFSLRKKDEYSTLKDISDDKLSTDTNSITNKHLTYPDLTGKRYTEGGLRTKNKYKHSLENKPLVTIITVVFNGEKFLERCILSVLNQTYCNIEYIIIDGGSTDSTLNIIKKYDDYIDYFVSEPDDGIYYAMNKGLELASGDYIAILNSDDYYYDFAVSSSIIKITEEGSDYSIAGHEFIDENYNIIHKSIPQKITGISFFNYCPAAHQTYFVSKICLEKIGYYDTNFRIASDYKLKLFLMKHFKYSLLDEYIVSCQFGGVSSDRDSSLNQVYQINMSFSNIDNEEDVKDLILFVSENNVPEDFFNRLNKMKIKYKFNELLYSELKKLYYTLRENELIVREDSLKSRRKLTFLEHIFSVYTKEKFIEIMFLGIKISIKRRNKG